MRAPDTAGYVTDCSRDDIATDRWANDGMWELRQEMVGSEDELIVLLRTWAVNEDDLRPVWQTDYPV